MFSRNDIKEVAALTAMQRGMLHHSLLEPDRAAYHEQLLLRLDGPVDADRLHAAWQQVVDRHDGLRGRFLAQRVSSPVQLIPHREQLTLERMQLPASPVPAGEDAHVLPPALEALLQADRERPFDPETAHPMRLLLASESADRHWLLWSFHHILVDGWSIGLVLEEVLAAWSGAALPPAADPAPYRRWLAGRDREAALAWWQQHLAGCQAEGLPPPEIRAAPGRASASVGVGGQCARQLRALAASQRCSLHHLLLAAWGLWLGRLTDQREVIVPTVLAGRPEEVPGAEAMVGLFIHTVPMRLGWQAGERFAELLQRTRDAGLEAARHQHLSLAEIQASCGALPLDHVLLVQGVPGQELVGRRCGEACIAQAWFRETLPYDLQVSLTPGEDAIGIELQGRHPQAALQAWAEGLQSLLEQLSLDPQQPLAQLGACSAQLQARLLRWGDGGPALQQGTLLQALERALQATPDAIALVAGTERLSYRALHARAARLAHRLQADGPLAPDTPVALVARRDADLVAGLLAILRCGAAYLPIDPDYPPERIRLMLQASACRQLLVSPGLQSALPPQQQARVLTLDDAPGPEAPPAAVTPQQLAYLIFTSGSTGIPKGVQVSHANASALLAALPPAIGRQGPQRVLGSTTVSFDISILELLGPLTWGDTLVLASADQARDPQLLLELLQREQVTLLQATPTKLRTLLEAEGGRQRLAGLQHLLVGGEALPAELAAQLLQLEGVRCCNVYGPTETTIWSSCWPLQAGPVRLGRALAGEQLLVLSQERQLQPPWAIGEIAIAGVGVARGYHGDPQRTAQRFIQLPGVAGRVYLTGDLGRWQDDGSLQGLGRRDEQVKLRGVRIELGEVEQALRQLPGVRQAAAAVRRGAQGGDELVAWLVGPTQADAAGWRAQLAQWLPAALLPSQFVLLDALPLTPAGKTDRRALPAPQGGAARPAQRAPAAGPEAAITAVFSELLGQPVGPDDDFFQAGGHSLLAIQAVGRINRALSSGYRLRDLYRRPSAAALARAPAAPDLPLQPGPPAADYPLSAQQQALWVLDQLQPGYAGYNVPGAWLVQGPLDEDRLERAWAAVVARHAALRTVFVAGSRGPRQRVLEQMPFAVERHALPPGADPEPLVREISCRPFDLARGPLFRLARIALAPQRSLLLLVLHHIASDGWSDALLTRDLETAWQALGRGADALQALPPPPALSYGDYALWQERYLASPLAQAHRSFWREQLAQLPLLELPASGRRANGLARPGARIGFRLPPRQAAEWLAAIRPDQRYAALVATTLALLHQAGGQRDLVLGLPVANRDRPQLQEQAGLHLNTLPLRLALAEGETAHQLQERCREAILEAMAHADYPFARLVQDLGLAAAPGRHPVFDAMLIFHQQAVPVPRLEGLQLSLPEGRSYAARFDLDFEVWVEAEAVHGFLEYDAGLFSAAEARALLDQWQALLLAGCRQPQQPLVRPAAGAPQVVELDEEF